MTLPCQGPPTPPIALLDWNRPELKKDGSVFFYRDGKLYESYQLERYRGRVQLKDPQMTDGDVSVILRNVSGSDNGTYECLMYLNTGPGQKPQLKHTVTLEVALEVKEIPEIKTETPHEPGNLSLKVGLSVAVGLLLVVVVVVVVFVYYRRFKRREPVVNDPDTGVPLNHD